MSDSRRWSIAGRITRWLVVATVSGALATAGVTAWFLRLSLEREVSALIEEELEELTLLVGDGPLERPEFSAFVAKLQSEHASNPMAFRVWLADADEPWGEFGHVELLDADVPSRDPTGATRRADDTRRWRTKPIGPGLVVGVVVDGTAQLALFRQFWLASLTIGGLAAAIALGVGAVVIRKFRRLLERVAERARSARWGTSEEDLRVDDAPLEIQRITDALAEMRRNIRQEAERARLLAGGMAHELGSPIQNLIVQGEVALMRERTGAELRRLVESQLEELRDLARVVGNLVAFCSMDVADANELEEFDLGHELELRLPRERARASKRGVRLDVRCQGDLTVRGDREALLLAIGNLVSNAIDWSPAGTEVEVAIVEWRDDIEVSVDDAGPGIPPELREKVFEPFHRGQSAQGRRQGYGLGLSIARAAVRIQAGSIEVGTSPAGGARMLVRLPKRTAPRSTVEAISGL